MGTKKNISNIFLATSLQRGFIYHALSEPDDDAYRVQSVLDLNLKLNIECYRQAWQCVLDQSPGLRVGFNWDHELLQIIYRDIPINFTHIDLSDEKDSESLIESYQHTERLKPFDLERPPLFRLLVLQHSDNSFTLIKTQHHSISDGWSGPLVMSRVHHYYEQLVKGQTVTVSEDRSYLDAQRYHASQG